MPRRHAVDTLVEPRADSDLDHGWNARAQARECHPASCQEDGQLQRLGRSASNAADAVDRGGTHARRPVQALAMEAVLLAADTLSRHGAAVPEARGESTSPVHRDHRRLSLSSQEQGPDAGREHSELAACNATRDYHTSWR